MLKAVPVTQAQLKGLNPKYPSDPVYYVRTQLKVNVHTVRTAAGTVYMTDEIFKTYSEGLAKERQRQMPPKQQPRRKQRRRRHPAATTQVSPAVVAGATKAGARAAALA